ncbi:hypothetical protein Q0812_07860 [Brevundimonas sp. 2R-24]|uniref:Lipoprotein n=1 Tax=Peiella sedimenti TaxID=3061083 RepID=A0ABT8SLI0_9CAUL|nr:hypothetical protein [Caulobacteraceae bacterium XZ-24]
MRIVSSLVLAAALLTGCATTPSPERPPSEYRPQHTGAASEIVFVDYRRGEFADDQLIITVTDARGTRRITERDFRPLNEVVNETGYFPTASEGSVRVRAELRRGGRLISQAELQLEARRDWFWGVGIDVSPNLNRPPPCIGCMGEAAAPIVGYDGPEELRFRLTFSGNSISAPGVY